MKTGEGDNTRFRETQRKKRDNSNRRKHRVRSRVKWVSSESRDQKARDQREGERRENKRERDEKRVVWDGRHTLYGKLSRAKRNIEGRWDCKQYPHTVYL